MIPAFRAGSLLLLLATSPALSTPTQGPCTTGCDTSFHLGITQDATYGPTGETVQVSVTSSGGDCIPVLGDNGVYCVSSGCETTVNYDVLGMDPDLEVWECHAKTLPILRTDCATPPPLTDTYGSSSSVDNPYLACGSGEHTFEIRCDGLTAQVRLTCDSCDL